MTLLSPMLQFYYQHACDIDALYILFLANYVFLFIMWLHVVCILYYNYSLLIALIQFSDWLFAKFP